MRCENLQHKYKYTKTFDAVLQKRGVGCRKQSFDNFQVISDNVLPGERLHDQPQGGRRGACRFIGSSTIQRARR
jgi:hypothetical protein